LDQAVFKLLRILTEFSRTRSCSIKSGGDHTFIEKHTVDVRIMRFRKSLAIAAEYMKTVRGEGYKPNAESSA